MIKGVRIGDITAKLSSSGIIVSKTRNPNHLTVCFNPSLNALDIHFRNQETGEKQYVISVPISDFEKSLLENEIKMTSILIPAFLKSLKRVKPGWLGHHGFYLVIFKEMDIKDLFLANSPTKKRRIEPNFKNVIKDVMSKSEKWLFHPRYLHILANNNFEGIVHAAGFRKSNRNKRLILFHLNINGNFGWYAISKGRMAYIMRNFFSNVFDKQAIDTLMKRIDRQFNSKT